MIKPCGRYPADILSVVIRKLEVKWESGRKVSPAQADSVLYLSFSSTYQKALLAHLFGVWLVMQQLSHPSSPSLHLSSFLSLSLSPHFIHLLSLLHANAQRHSCFLRDGCWTQTWTGCKDFPNQDLFDLLMYTHICGVNACTVGVAL